MHFLTAVLIDFAYCSLRDGYKYIYHGGKQNSANNIGMPVVFLPGAGERPLVTYTISTGGGFFSSVIDKAMRLGVRQAYMCVNNHKQSDVQRNRS